MPKESRRVRMTKKMMKEALIELSKEMPLSKITVTAICEKADVNRSTFYAYYEDVETLLREIEEQVLTHIVFPPTTPHTICDKQFLEMLTSFFGYVKQNEELFRVLILQDPTGNFNQKLVELVVDKCRQKTFTRDSVVSRYGYIYSVNGVIAVVKEWIGDGFSVEVETFAKIIYYMSVRATENQNIAL